jgi:hypothetical protein
MMKTALGTSLVAVLAFAVAPMVSAKGLSYSYADVGYMYFDGEDYKMDSGTVDASFGVFDLVALRGGYTRGWTDDFDTGSEQSDDPDLNEFRFGVRPHYSLTDNIDAYVDLLYLNKKYNGSRSSTEIGGIYGAGLRYQAIKKLELDLGGEYQSADIDAGFLKLGGIYTITKAVGISLSTSQGSDDRSYFAGLRLNF